MLKQAAVERFQPLKDIQVLLVEDELDIAVLLTYLLEDNGAAVTVTTTALEALQVLNAQCPQILVCNLRLPDLDGKELIEQVRQAPATAVRQLPAIAVTSYNREYSETTAFNAGFDYFLAKPIEPKPLIEAILQLLPNGI
ncbi:response regulator [Phormidium sp. FACHB-592]|uniref:Response regulator n=1 Tax=Stenomitos frigidus AS-A4 TaxID=2933935 RepID=A0ABV0KSY4_9CYAN|nr:response regulator [Phormidium sp. FACHB-592]MBD2072422.1 response regulator [Phormidium sp. FACHB-592]